MSEEEQFKEAREKWIQLSKCNKIFRIKRSLNKRLHIY